MAVSREPADVSPVAAVAVMAEHLAAIRASLDSIDCKIDSIDAKLDSIDAKLDRLDEGMSAGFARLTSAILALGKK